MTVERGWLSVVEAAQYVGVAQQVIRGAIDAHELRAYRKPQTDKRTKGQRRYLKISVRDLDAWVRSWPSAWEE